MALLFYALLLNQAGYNLIYILMKDYYIYIYLDPRKIGNFVFEDITFDYEPIYVGKGIKDRVKRHLYLCKKSKTYFHNKLKLILNEGFEPIYKIIKTSLTEEQALTEEIKLIKLIGREENGGTLTNLSDGGEGQSGYKHREESKIKTSISLKNNKEFQDYLKTDDFKSKVSKGLIGHIGYGKGVPRTEEVKNKIKEKLKGRPGRKHTQKSKQKMSENNSGKGNPNSKIYTIQFGDSILIFETIKELSEYVEKYNVENNLKGPKRVSVEGILYKGISKNFKLLEKSYI